MNEMQPTTRDRRHVGQWLAGLIAGGLGVLLGPRHTAATPIRSESRRPPDCPPSGPERRRCLQRDRRQRRRQRRQENLHCRRRQRQGKNCRRVRFN